jgi:hypothetical protein
VIFEIVSLESSSIIYDFSIFKKDSDMTWFVSVNRKRLKFKTLSLSKSLIRIRIQNYMRLTCSYCMQWMKIHCNLENSSFCNFTTSSILTLCRLLIFLLVNEHCSYQCKNLSLYIKSCRSYFANSFFSNAMNFEQVSLLILIERLWLMMYVDFNLFRKIDLRCLEIFNKKWQSWTKKSSLSTFSSRYTKLFKNAEQSARSLISCLNIFKSIWRKDSFNNHLMICINWSFRKICLIDLRWLNDEIVFLKKRCLFSSNKTLTFHKTSYFCMMLSKCILMWKFDNFSVSSFLTSFKVEAFKNSIWLGWKVWFNIMKSSKKELIDVTKIELCLKLIKLSTSLLLIFRFLLVNFEVWTTFIKLKIIVLRQEFVDWMFLDLEWINKTMILTYCFLRILQTQTQWYFLSNWIFDEDLKIWRSIDSWKILANDVFSINNATITNSCQSRDMNKRGFLSEEEY